MPSKMPPTQKGLNDGFQAPYLGSNTNYTTGAASAQSFAMPDGCSLVIISPEKDTYIAIGTNPTATTASKIVRGGAEVGYGIEPGEKVAYLQVSASGNISICAAK